MIDKHILYFLKHEPKLSFENIRHKTWLAFVVFEEFDKGKMLIHINNKITSKKLFDEVYFHELAHLVLFKKYQKFLSRIIKNKDEKTYSKLNFHDNEFKIIERELIKFNAHQKNERKK